MPVLRERAMRRVAKRQDRDIGDKVVRTTRNGNARLVDADERGARRCVEGA